MRVHDVYMDTHPDLHMQGLLLAHVFFLSVVHVLAERGEQHLSHKLKRHITVSKGAAERRTALGFAGGTPGSSETFCATHLLQPYLGRDRT
jgi:hypothetical protein